MSGELLVTVIGLTHEPELRRTPACKRVTMVTIAQNPRFVDRATGEWTDGDPVFVRCNIWDDMAENAVNSLARGTRVMAYGQLRQHSWETENGERRWSTELLVASIGPDLRFATVGWVRGGVCCCGSPLARAWIGSGHLSLDWNAR